MQRRRTDSHNGSHPATCRVCTRDFVNATELVDFIDEGLFRLRLKCANCGDERIAELEDSELERLEQAHLDAQAQMIDDIALLGSHITDEASA